MKKINLFLAFIMAFFLISCENDDITVTINESGSLEIRVVDDNNRPIQNATVILEDTKSSITLLSESVNENGILKIEKLLQGTYKAYVTVVENNRKYSSTSYFQIIAKDSKKLEVNPYANSSNLSISIETDGTVSDLSQYTIALVPYGTGSNIDKIKSNAYFSTNLNADKQVEFEKVPAEKQYSLVIYKGSVIYFYSDNILKTKEAQQINVTVYFKEVLASVQGISSNYTEYEVYLLENRYTNESLSVEGIKKSAQFFEKVGIDGKINFQEIGQSDYNNRWIAYLVKNNQIYDRVVFDFYYSYKVVEVPLSIGSLTLNVKGSFHGGRETYSLAVTRGRDFESVKSLEENAILKTKLTTSETVHFAELPLWEIRGMSSSYSFYVFLYKDDKIYDSSYFSWYDTNEEENIYLSAYEY